MISLADDIDFNKDAFRESLLDASRRETPFYSVTETTVTFAWAHELDGANINSQIQLSLRSFLEHKLDWCLQHRNAMMSKYLFQRRTHTTMSPLLPSTECFGILEDQIYDLVIHPDVDIVVKSDLYDGDWALHRWRTIVPAGLRYDDEYASHWQSRAVSGHDTALLQQIFWSADDKPGNSPVFTKNGGDVLRPGIEEWGPPLEIALPSLAQRGFKLKFPEGLSPAAADDDDDEESKTPASDEDQYDGQQHEEVWPAEEDNSEDLDFELRKDERIIFVLPQSPSKSPRKTPQDSAQAHHSATKMQRLPT